MSKLMNIFKSVFQQQAQSGSVAKERLSLMLVTQRSSAFLSQIDMEAFQNEVAVVVKKYMKIAANKNPQVAIKPDGDVDVLEMHFPLEFITREGATTNTKSNKRKGKLAA